MEIKQIVNTGPERGTHGSHQSVVDSNPLARSHHSGRMEMRKQEILAACGYDTFRLGSKFQAAPDSETPDVRFEIVELGLWVDAKTGEQVESGGVHALRLRYADGSEEVAAVATLKDALNCGIKRVLA